MKNFHVPLPEETYTQLRAAAARTEVPATALAREAIDAWLRQRAREERRAAIAEYVEAVAGTLDDLDPALEEAGLESLAKLEKWQ